MERSTPLTSKTISSCSIRSCVLLAVFFLLASTFVVRGQSLSPNIYYIGDGPYTMDAGWALNPQYGTGAADIYLYALNGSTNQQFNFVSAGSGQGTLQSVTNPSMCLGNTNGVLTLGAGCDTFTITANGGGFTIQDNSAGGSYVQDPGVASPPHRLSLSSKSTSWKFSPVSGSSQVTPPPPSGTVVSSTNPSVVFSTRSSSTPNWGVSGGSLYHSNLARTGGAFLGASVEISFSGTGITWVGQQGPNFGIAYVSVDGQAVQQIDNYNPQNVFPDNVYTVTNLTPGSHTLWVEVTPFKNSNSIDVYQDMVQFNVIGGSPITATAIVPSWNGSVTRNGNWSCGENNPTDLSGGHCWSFTNDDSMSWTFSGSMVQVFGRPDSENGPFSVSIDGKYVESVNGTFGTVDDDTLNGALMVVAAGLGGGQHTITLVNTGNGKAVQIDEFRSYR
jgi:hypothetical protein